MHAISSRHTSHPILPYAEALEKEHEENLLSPHASPLADLLAQHAATSAHNARVIMVRGAGPTRPFRGDPSVAHRG